MMIRYHDEEWGVPVHDSRALWEALVINGFQAGLPWRIMLAEREAFRAAFKGFDPQVVAELDERDVERLMADKASCAAMRKYARRSGTRVLI